LLKLIYSKHNRKRNEGELIAAACGRSCQMDCQTGTLAPRTCFERRDLSNTLASVCGRF
jgi:hypothetical protein